MGRKEDLNIKTLCDRIFNLYRLDSKINLSKELEEINNTEFISFLVFLLKNYTDSISHELLLKLNNRFLSLSFNQVFTIVESLEDTKIAKRSLAEFYVMYTGLEDMGILLNLKLPSVNLDLKEFNRNWFKRRAPSLGLTEKDIFLLQGFKRFP